METTDPIALAFKELDRLATRELVMGGSGERTHQIESAARVRYGGLIASRNTMVARVLRAAGAVCAEPLLDVRDEHCRKCVLYSSCKQPGSSALSASLESLGG